MELAFLLSALALRGSHEELSLCHSSWLGHICGHGCGHGCTTVYLPISIDVYWIFAIANIVISIVVHVSLCTHKSVVLRMCSWTSSISITWVSVEMQILRPCLRLTGLDPPGQSPGICIVTSPLGDAGACWSLRTTTLCFVTEAYPQIYY